MKQAPFTTDKGEFLAIELPPFQKIEVHNIGKKQVLFIDGYAKLAEYALPEGSWQIITPNASEATEEQAREIVGMNLVGEHEYDFVEDLGGMGDYMSDKKSLESLLQHLGLTGTVTVLKKVK